VFGPGTSGFQRKITLPPSPCCARSLYPLGVNSAHAGPGSLEKALVAAPQAVKHALSYHNMVPMGAGRQPLPRKTVPRRHLPVISGLR